MPLSGTYRTARGSDPARMGSWKAGPALPTYLYDSKTHLEDKGKAVDVAYLDFSKDSDTVSHSSLLEKLIMDWMGTLFASNK